MGKLYRKRNSKLAGICSGLGQYFNVDETLIRLLFVIMIFSPVPIILGYILSWMVIPKEPKIKLENTNE